MYIYMSVYKKIGWHEIVVDEQTKQIVSGIS